MFTTKHYEAVADLFRSVSATNKKFFISQFIIIFSRDSIRFDEDKFIKACGVKVKPIPGDER